jgi:hypothetical protein
MKKIIKILFATASITLTIGCGGGGGGISDTSESLSNSKYVGSYYYCDGDHISFSVTLTDAGNGNLNATPLEVTYQNSNCTGNILATYSESRPTAMIYTGNSIVSVNAPGFPSSTSLDKFRASIPSMQAILVGPGVVGNCVNYPGGRFCYNLSVVAENLDIGFQQSDNGFHAFLLENGIYQYNDFYTKY